MIKKLALKLKMSKFSLVTSIFLILLVTISLGSAFLKDTLSIIGNSTIKKSSWVIYFDDVQKATDSINSEKDARIVDFKKTRIEFSADLKNPGDFYEFTVYTVNDGTIDAMVKSIDTSELTDEQKKYLTFEVTYDNGDPIRPCDPLDAGTRRWIKAIVKFNDNLPLEDYPTDDVHLDLYFNINYVQKDDTCTPTPQKNQHILTIKPAGGTYNNRHDDTRIYLEKNETYTVTYPERELYNFKGWNVIAPEENGTYTFENGLFTMGDEDVTIEATWEEGDYVARIMTTYYPTIQEAFDAAKHSDFADNTVYLLKDTTEYPTNNTTDDFVFDLGGHTVTGTITNASDGDITLINGRLEAAPEDKEAFINYGKLNLGIDDGIVYVENSIALIGNSVGLTNKEGSEFYFYDGYIEGLSGLVGGYTKLADEHYVFADHNDIKNCQRVYLVKNPSRAVARTSTPSTNDVYYYNLQDAFISAKLNKEALIPDSDNNFIVYAYRNFEAAYELNIPENSRIFFDTMGHTISIGNNVTNDGYFNIQSSDENKGKLKTSFTIVNNGVMDIDDVDLAATTDSNIIQNNNTLNLDNTRITSKGGYGVYNNTDAIITFTEDTVLDSNNSYGLYNKSNNLIIDNGTIYGIYNTGSIVLDENTKLHAYKIDDRNYIPAIYNSGTITMDDGEISTNYDTTLIYNNGTFTINDGNISAYATAVSNYFNNRYGTLNANGGLITSQNYTVSSGTVNIKENGEIKSVNRTAINGADVNIYAGDVYSDNDTAISCGGQTINVYGGLVKGENVGISGCNVNVSGGRVTGSSYGVSTNYGLTMTGGKVDSENIAASVSSANISGGEISSTNDALIATNSTITGGTIHSEDANAVTVTGTGTINGSQTDIYGGMYGVYNKGTLTIGSFTDSDEDDPQDYPAIVGGSYGLYIDGPVTNFYDGILKGQVDGYTGRITGLPLATIVGEGEEEINGELYQTDFIARYENWLRVGEEEFNSIDAASKAIPEGEEGTITVIKDANLIFTQHFVDNGTEETGYKKITFDLNGHTISSTQTIYVDSDVTIVDGSDEKTGTIKPTRVAGITNRNKLTIKAGNYLSEVVDEVIINESGLITIDDAYFKVNKYAITNNSNLVINDINIEESYEGINNKGNTTVHGGTINGSNMGISSNYNYNVGTVYVDGGTIYGENYGIGGGGASVHVAGGEVTSNTNNAIYSYHGNITVSGGKVTSNTNTALVTAQVTNVSGGEVTGTIGIKHICYSTGWGSCVYHNINVTGGLIKGTDTYGIHAISANLFIHSGDIYGEVDGVYTTAETQIGDDEGTVLTTTPTLTGKRYGLNTSSYVKFFDGILRGMDEAHNGLIGLIPDAYMIKDDYAYIERDYYKTQYLIPVGNWLRVNGQEYNTLTKATAAIDSTGTIEVIADAYVDYEQVLPYGKNITFDLNGHSVIMTQPLQTKGTNTIKDSIGNGGITNIRSNGNAANYNTAAVYNTGTLTIEGGNFKANEDYAINNGGSLTVDNLTIENYGGIYSDGTLVINGGYIEGTVTHSLNTWGTTTINGGEIVSNVQNNNVYPVIIENGTTTINGGTITSNYGTGVAVSKGSYYSLGHVVVNGGEITGKTNGMINTTSDNTIRINGGTITGIDNNGLNTSSHNCVILGGSIIGGNYGLYTTGYTTLGDVEDNSIDITQPLLQGELYGLYIDGGTLNFYDGILKGQIDANSGVITNIPNRAQIYEDSEVIDGNTYDVKYLIMESIIAYNRETEVEYTNLQDAINEADTDQTIVLVANVPLYYAVTNNNTKHFTIDLNGYNISTNKTITNKGNIDLINSSDKTVTIKTSSAVNLINNTGTLSISNIKLINNSSSNYVINNTNKTTLNNVIIDAINAVATSNNLIINDSIISASKIAINNSMNVTITGGNYSGGNYSIYSNGSSNQGTVTISGTDTQHVIINGNVENIRTELTVNDTDIIIASNGSLSNNATAIFTRVNITNTNGGSISNSGTMKINNSNVTLNSPQYYNNSDTYIAIYNGGNLEINETNIDVDKFNTYKTYVKGISNSGTLNLQNESNLNVGNTDHKNGCYFGIDTTGSGNTYINNSVINVIGSNINYGVYMTSSNAITTLETGEINVSGAPTTYGAYINPGTFVMGHYDNSIDNVSTENPIIYSAGTTKGIGVNKANGSFKFYDGVIWASRFARYGTTTNVEKDHEVTTYVDEETSFEYAWLEYIKNDYSGDTVAKYNETYYTSLQSAIDAYDTELGGEIILLKPIADEELIEVISGKKAIINLGGYSITTKIINNGTLDVYNGTVMNFEDYAVVNNGTFNMGKNDGTVSSVSIRLISENIAVENNGTFNMYDGYIEGTKAIEGEINSIADLARIVTKREDQSERKYLQSLSEADIIAGNTDLYLTIDPKSGYYDGSKEVRLVFLKYQVPYELSTNLEKNACEFDHWEVSEEGVLENNIIRMNLSDVTLTAVWRVKDEAVAKIGDEYYISIAEALENANENDTIELLKDQTEDVINDKNITLDLGGHTITGAFVNNGILTILNGTIYNPNGVGLVNNKSLTMGQNDGEINTEAIAIKGETVGLEQNGKFNFYDGYIEGTFTVSGSINSLPRGYTFYTEPVPGTTYQRSFLNGNPANAVAIIENGGENVQYFFNLQNAIDTANYMNKPVSIIRDFEAAYQVEVKEGYNIAINMQSYNITTGSTITNNGNLRIYDESENPGSITSASPITNNGTLSIENIILKQMTNSNTINNNGELNITNSNIIAKNGYAVSNNGSITMDNESYLKSDVYALLNNNENAVISSGNIQGVEAAKNITINGDTNLINNGSRAAIQFTNNNTTVTLDGVTVNAYNGLTCNRDGSKFVVNNTTINTSNIAVRLENTSCKLEMSDSSLTSSNEAIRIIGYGTVLTINDSDVTSTSSTGIYDDSYKSTWGTITLNNTNVKGVNYGVRTYYDNFYQNGGSITTTSSNTSHYALQCYSSYCEVKGEVKANNTHALYMYASNVLLDGAEIYTGRTNGYGVHQLSNTLTIKNGTTITAPGLSSYGIYRYSDYDSATINLEDGAIKSGNVGIYMYSYSGRCSTTLNVKNGSVEGNTYGIQHASSTVTTTIGTLTAEESITNPYVSGGLYGLYKTEGTAYFYNGRLRGYINGYNDMFNGIKNAKDITTEIEMGTIPSNYTTDYSDDPVSKFAKVGNGSAKFTYLGETIENVCEQNQEYVFNYVNDEEIFNVPCTGNYIIEVWGAQGGSVNTTYLGGYGGYTTGEITLQAGDMLYVNVGGAGNVCTRTNCTVNGGYNGGGNAKAYNGCDYYSASSGSGGGATHIATASGFLKDLENNKESIIIVAGGGGGGNYCNGYNYSTGGSGGGLVGGSAINLGARDWVANGGVTATGGTQESGSAFGQGQSYTSDLANIGSGAGYYGGKTTQIDGSGGGSGYANQQYLTNISMYGYKIPSNVYKINYMVDKEAFLEVNGETYNSIDAAVAAIEEIGTIKVIKDASIQDTSSITNGKTITFDLNGHTLTMTQPIVNEGNLTIIDSTNTTGTIDNKKNNTINNKGTLVVDNVTLKSTNSSTIYGGSGSGTITLQNNPTIISTSSNGIYVDSAQQIIMNSGTIQAGNVGIGLNGANSKFEMNGGSITSSSHGVYHQGTGTIVTINDGEIKSTSQSGIYRDNWSTPYATVTVNGGTVTGAEYGIRTLYENVYVNGGEIKTTSTNRDRYTIYAYYATVSVKDAELTAEHASGIYMAAADVTLENVQIYAGASNGFGVNHATSTLTVSGDTEITTPGTSAYGIYHSSDYDTVTMNINNVTINSGNVGIYAYANPSRCTATINLRNGSIEGNNYGIQSASSAVTTYLGKLDDELNQQVPYIFGDIISIKMDAGNLYFYNGRLKGKQGLETFNGIRPDMDVIKIEEVFGSERGELTYSTNNHSVEPTSTYAKEGNGHVRITYEGDTISGVCENGQVYDYSYVNGEEEFTTPCTGTYKLEAWGAQGGRAICNGNECTVGGYGGYTVGNIDLIQNEVLYINVGGQGSVGSLTSCALGGYNGGGRGTNDGGGCSSASDNEASGGGGGATHIATASGLLKELVNDKESIIMVAGGGGGASYDMEPGSGGGFKGGRTDYTSSYESSLLSGYAFGQGQDGDGAANSDGVAGGGGGYYGGYANNVDSKSSGTGGSGYNCNSRVTNNYMYGYNVEVSSTMYIINYLQEKEDFLEVNGVTYNSIDAAVAAIEETGTIKVIKNTTLQFSGTITSGKTITFDLNGHTLTMTQPIVNEGNLTIIDSTNTTGTIDNKKNNTINNKGTLVVDNVTLKSTNSSTIYGGSGSGTITLQNNPTIISTSSNGIYVDSAQQIIMNSGTIQAGNVGIGLNGANSKFEMNGGSITSSSHGVYHQGTGTIVTINDGEIKSTSQSGIYRDNWSTPYATVTVNGGTVTGAEYGIRTLYENVYVNGGEIKTTSTNRDRYTIYAYYATVSVKDAELTAEHASGIYMAAADVTLENVQIYAGASNGFGVNHATSTLTVSGDTEITTPGTSAYGIYHSSDYDTVTMNINNVTINSGNVGIYAYANLSRCTATINLKNGTVEGKTYGIQSASNAVTTNLGSLSNPPSAYIPMVIGGMYGMYISDGTVNFYNGRLKGTTGAYYGTIANTRQGYELYEENSNEISLDLQATRTYSTENVSEDPISENAKALNGAAKITYIGDSVYQSNYEKNYYINCYEMLNFEYKYSYTGNVQDFIAYCPGTYKIELWGAQGGSYEYNGTGDKGAYTSGIIDLAKDEKLYIYVGQGEGSRNASSFNGTTSSSGSGTPGGGATDVRLVSGAWNNTSSLRSRIMVAAGGGSEESGNWGGAAGGLVGYSSSRNGYTNTGGSQTGPGVGQEDPNGCATGSFGIGSTCGATGGGGYYGGGGASHRYGSGSGGSSYISGHTGAVAITSADDQSPKSDCTTGTSDIECSYHYSGKIFTDTVMIDGLGYNWTNEKGEYVGMPNTAGTGIETGHAGNGYAKITLLSLDESYDIKVYFRSNPGIITNTVKSYSYGDTIGELETPLTESNLFFDGWYLEPYFKTRVDENYVVKENTELFAKFVYVNNECSLEPGTSQTYSYSGEEETYIAACNGAYRLETWGAQGGGPKGGYGGYSDGYIDLEKDTILYINVGGQGAQYDGGYNGGGRGGSGGGQWSYGGGGATHIATASGLLSSLEDNKQSVLIVAAGGGGDGGSGTTSPGGHAGGYEGKSGYDGHNNTYGGYNGTGATQTSGGKLANGSCGYGSFGRGSDFCNSGYGGAGGGAGYYGGGGSNRGHGGGGGGSSYIANPNLYNKRMYAYKASSRFPSEYVKEVYLVKERDFILNGTTAYSNLQTAIDEAQDGDTLVFTDNSSISYSVIIPSGKEITIDLNNHVLTTTKNITNNGTLHIIDSSINSANGSSFEQTFEYTGDYQEFVAPETGTYKIEAWGAQGSSRVGSDTLPDRTGGKGAYTSGNINLNQGETIYIYVGEKGQTVEVTGANTSKPYGEYNFNGGAGGNYTCYNYVQSNGGSFVYNLYGGSATDIRLKGGNWDDINSLSSRIMVAAGGAGANENEDGAPGGTLNGISGTHGTGATQTSAGGPNSGSFGKGGTPTYGGDRCNSSIATGAGAGYYGGGAYNRNIDSNGMGSAGSGSSYISGYTGSVAITAEGDLTPKSGCSNGTTNQACSVHYSGREFTDAIMKSGNEEMPNHTGTGYITGNTGDGYVRITSNLSTKTPSSKIVSNLSNTLIVNNGTLSIDDVNIDGYNNIENRENGILSISNSIVKSRNQAIINSGKYSIDNSTIQGSSYAIYDNSTQENEINNSTLQASTTIYINSTPNLVVNDTEIVGNINNSKTNGILTINNTENKNIKGIISNTGKTTIKKANITFSYNEWNEYNMISNSGILTLNNNTITFNDNYSSANNYVRIISSSGTINSTNNTYTINRSYVNGSNHYRYVVGIYSTAILNSNGDTFNLSNAEQAYAISSNSTNENTIKNIEINMDQVNNIYGIYSNNTGTIDLDTGELNLTNSANINGVYVDSGTFTSRNVNYHINATNNANGVYINNGTFTIESGNIYVNAANTAYGIRINDNSTSGVMTLGIYEGNGYESTSTSTTDPYIEAIGTTGYGIARGNGTFNFYDGRFAGSTNARTAGSITSSVERNYQLKTVSATDDEYEYCILEFMM